MSFRADRRHTEMTALQLTDETAFSALVERHRRELQVHCYRMLGSFEESEDLTQETFLRAWRSRDTYAGRASLRAWLYRIATNACLDSLEKRPRVPTASGEVTWLQPYPDELLEAIPAGDDSEPDALVVARETIELAFMIAIQHLPPRPRAVLLLRDVLGWRAKDTAELLETSVASVNSALQRARAGLKEHLPERRSEWVAGDVSAADRELLQRYIEACEQGDLQSLTTILHEDLRFSMPPEPGIFEGRESVVGGWVDGGFGDTERFGQMRCLATSANGQAAVACYVKGPGEDRYRSLALDVLTVSAGAIVEITMFSGDLFGAFGLPVEL
jgi:RNA polymerase sigma-70 factor (TIGR02960 family)